eukprot:scaffold681661_cov65-Prasinocladus_malaysianus.AAC.1
MAFIDNRGASSSIAFDLCVHLQVTPTAANPAAPTDKRAAARRVNDDALRLLNFDCLLRAVWPSDGRSFDNVMPSFSASNSMKTAVSLIYLESITCRSESLNHDDIVSINRRFAIVS